MAAENVNYLSAEDEQKLLAPIEEYVGKIQKEINELRVDGTDKVTALTNQIAIIKENANYTKIEKKEIIDDIRKELAQAKAVEEKNRDRIKSLINDAEQYLDAHYDSEYYSRVAAACAADREAEDKRYEAELAGLKKEYERIFSGLTDKEEIKDEKYVYKNRVFDANLKHDATLQEIKNRQHDAFMEKYHLIDLLRLSKFTTKE